jgi:hypothetical protein
VQPQPDRKARPARDPGYDRRYGETDLFEGETRRSGELILTVAGVVILGALCVGVLAV